MSTTGAEIHLNNNKKHHLPGSPSFSNMDIIFVQGLVFMPIRISQ
jgi:hypothetical protein